MFAYFKHKQTLHSTQLCVCFDHEIIIYWINRLLLLLLLVAVTVATSTAARHSLPRKCWQLSQKCNWSFRSNDIYMRSSDEEKRTTTKSQWCTEHQNQNGIKNDDFVCFKREMMLINLNDQK